MLFKKISSKRKISSGKKPNVPGWCEFFQSSKTFGGLLNNKKLGKPKDHNASIFFLKNIFPFQTITAALFMIFIILSFNAQMNDFGAKFLTSWATSVYKNK